MEVIDPANYHGFCLRGEGRANFVISAKNEKNGLRIVWRIAKHRKSGLISPNQKCELLGQYIEKFISPFISESYLVKMRIVRMRIDDFKQIAKIPSLPHNYRVDSFVDLCDSSNYSEELTVFPQSSVHLVKTYPYIDIIEMVDATRIPKRLSNTYGPTITFELKPKQGFYQNHPGFNIPFCNNCVLQLEKSKSGTFETMYDFCPLDLFSGNLTRMYSALESLIANPHRNLRIFLDGEPIHDELSVFSRKGLESLLFPNSPIQLNLLIKALCCVLCNVHDDLQPFHLREDSILSTLLKAQKIDPIGIIQARQIYENLPTDIQQQLLDKKNLLTRPNIDFLTANDPQSQLERYFLAGTMKDCSLMISFRLVQGVSRLSVDDPSSLYTVRVRTMPQSDPIIFTYSIYVVDLDPKSPHNLLNAYQRYVSGANTIINSPCFHKSCQI